jgi:acetyl-CoA carboxylase alpha subunit
MSDTIKKVILDTLKELEPLAAEERVQGRIEKFSNMGFFTEGKEEKTAG